MLRKALLLDPHGWICIPAVALIISVVACQKKIAVVPGLPPTSAVLPHQAARQEQIEPVFTDVYFEYGRTALNDQALVILKRNAAIIQGFLRGFGEASIIVEGHSEERGSEEYSLGLADRRAEWVKEYLVGLGLPGDRLYTISYGSARSQCSEPDENCGQRNRRVHLVARR
jgi:peptidoglycan-associated lipoprotein